MLKTLSAMILLLPAITACATPGPQKIVSDACLNFSSISFAELPRAEIEAALAEGRDVRDDGNAADSNETVGEISIHNARYDSLCAPESGG